MSYCDHEEHTGLTAALIVCQAERDKLSGALASAIESARRRGAERDALETAISDLSARLTACEAERDAAKKELLLQTQRRFAELEEHAECERDLLAELSRLRTVCENQAQFVKSLADKKVLTLAEIAEFHGICCVALSPPATPAE